MEYKNINCKTVGAVVHVDLRCPPVNALSQAAYRELAHAFQHIDEVAPGARVVVLSGQGDHFCAGNDLQEFAELSPDNAAARMVEVHEAFFAISRCQLPVVGAVQGAALGSGLVLAASCDFVIASDDARFGVPELNVGVLGGARHLSRLVPEPVLRWMYFTSDPVPVTHLVTYGALITVVDRNRLLEEALKVATHVARHSASSLRYAKKALNMIEPMAIEEGYLYEQGLTVEFCAHPDSREAINAVVEHREPRYVHAT